jgi:hypothetical protein
MIVARLITGDLKVRLGPRSHAPSQHALARVSAIWDAEKGKGGAALFNGNLFSVDQLGDTEIAGWLAEYRWFLAQRREPALRTELRVNPLAVTGILCCTEGVVIGRRAANVEMDAGLWEFAPSGGIDGSATGSAGEIDLVHPLIVELEEELGILAREISGPTRPIAIVEDRGSHVTDIGLVVEVSLSMAEIRRRHSALANREYVEIDVMPVAALSRHQEAGSRSRQLSAASQAFASVVVRSKMLRR